MTLGCHGLRYGCRSTAGHGGDLGGTDGSQLSLIAISGYENPWKVENSPPKIVFPYEKHVFLSSQVSLQKSNHGNRPVQHTWGSHAIALQDLQKLRSEFHAAETATATAQADLVHEEISSRVLLLLGW